MAVRRKIGFIVAAVRMRRVYSRSSETESEARLHFL
jgi:hypothetical protein